jgi:hypothetical protein
MSAGRALCLGRRRTRTAEARGSRVAAATVAVAINRFRPNRRGYLLCGWGMARRGWRRVVRRWSAAGRCRICNRTVQVASQWWTVRRVCSLCVAWLRTKVSAIWWRFCRSMRCRISLRTTSVRTTESSDRLWLWWWWLQQYEKIFVFATVLLLNYYLH